MDMLYRDFRVFTASDKDYNVHNKPQPQGLMPQTHQLRGCGMLLIGERLSNAFAYMSNR